ncbi:MAG: XdhC family protein [Bacteroidales bacterium]|nr:XdhC family protein [Bacteroidales bacterium]
MKNIYSELNELIKSGKNAALCVVVETKGSTPRKAGSKMIVYDNKKILGTIGGGSIEFNVIDKAIEVIQNNTPQKFTFNLENDLDMTCGGYVEVYIEPVFPLPKLYIFGAGHVGKAVAEFASKTGFEITLFDEREGIFKSITLQNTKFVQGNYFEEIEKANFDNNTYVVVTTPKHAYDEDITAICAKKLHAYLGMIGSKRKVATAKKVFLEERGLKSEEIESIDMPIGIKFAAQTPEEIAISIVAKLIDVKNSTEGKK